MPGVCRECKGDTHRGTGCERCGYNKRGYAPNGFSMPCPDCKGRKNFCLTCCGIGEKYVDEWAPSDAFERYRITQLYNEFMEREVT